MQSCTLCGFKLMPHNFFDANPLINLPSETNQASKSNGAAACCGE